MSLADRSDLAQAVLEASADGILVVDAEGRVLICNEAAERLLGQEQGQLRGATFGVPAIDPGDDAGLEIRLLADGSRKVELRSAETRWDGRPVTVVTLRDVTERLRALEELRDSRTLLQQIVAGLDEAVLVTEATEGGRRIRMVNPAAERMFGYDAGELVGMDPGRLHVEPEGAARARARLEAEGLDGPIQLAQPLRRKDGTSFDAEQTLSMLDPGADGGLERVVNVVRDVSAQQRAQVELRASEARFRQIAEHIHDVFWIATPRHDRVEYVSPAFRDVWGRDPDELYRDPALWLRTILPSDRDRVRETVTTQARGGWEEEYRIIRPDGEVRWIWDRAFPVEEGGRVERIIGVAEDVTERRRAEERFGVLTQEITDLIYVVSPDGRVRYVSPAADRIAGLSAQDLVGTYGFDWVHPEDRDPVREAFQAIVPVPGAVGRIQFRVVTGTGEVRHVESVARNRLDHPAIEGIVVTTRDITERVRLEEQLRQSQKMEAVGQLAGGIAHDFNNLLTVIRSETDLILMDLEAESPLSAEVRAIQGAADRAARLTSQLLAFSREQVLRPRTVDLSDVVREMGQMLERIIGEDVVLEYRLGADLPPVRIDPGLLEQAILNLAVNARDAMPAGGRLTLSTAAERDRPPAEGPDPGLPEGPSVVLRVTDTGHGMEESVRARIFEPFYTTKGTGKGTGLGLAMTYGFVKQSGGSIHVESAPGEGTTFVLRFPAVEGEPVPWAALGRPHPPEPEASARVLVVEDDPDVRRVAARILRRAGLGVDTVEDAESGLRALEEGAGYALLLTDLVLPGMSGRTLVDAVRATHPELRVVVMSGYAEGSPENRVDLPEEIGFVQKPFTPEGLVDAVKSALGR